MTRNSSIARAWKVERRRVQYIVCDSGASFSWETEIECRGLGFPWSAAKFERIRVQYMVRDPRASVSKETENESSVQRTRIFAAMWQRVLENWENVCAYIVRDSRAFISKEMVIHTHTHTSGCVRVWVNVKDSDFHDLSDSLKEIKRCVCIYSSWTMCIDLKWIGDSLKRTCCLWREPVVSPAKETPYALSPVD